ncbi:MAG TPA: patatin-like phospholipase family protein [Steroidobacteraceae bacterium]|nr:patatin-like phospholipase family protein [Steroidobacteraceae bacterium]
MCARATTPGVLSLILAAQSLALPAIGHSQSRAAAPGAAESAPQHRPRVGLVLSGGGARGTAHIGVLKVLEQMRVPVDAIAGTSMGAVVGGLYASGLSASEIEKIMTSINWQDAFRDRPPREDLTLRRKEEDENFLVKFPLGVRGGHVRLPKGLVQGQKLTETLRRLTLPVAPINDFDQLPTAFRAVATDLESGETVIMRSGDLTSAMRASLSAPGVFAPVEREGRLLVDGGITDNVPIDIARAMGVDVVIAVDVGFPLLTREQLGSAPVISAQMLAILIRRNSDAQLATLKGQDVLIRPPLGDTSSFDFGGVARVIGVGEAAARDLAGRLAALSVSEEDMERYVQRREASRVPAPRIDFVHTDPGSEAYGPVVADLFGDLTGKTLDPEAAAERVTELYGRGGFDTLDYHVVAQGQRYGLAVDARRNSIGPHYLRFGVSLQDDFQGNSTYDAAVRLVMSDVTPNSGEWVTDGQIGNVSRVSTELFQPVRGFSGWFVMPHAQAMSRDLDIFPSLVPGSTLQGQGLLAEYRVHSIDFGLDFGRQFGNWGEIRTGILREQGHFLLKIGDPTDPNLPLPQTFTPFNTHNYFVRFTYDRLDDINFPRRGQRANLEWSGERNVSGTERPSDQVTLNYLGAFTRGRTTFSFSASGGMTLQSKKFTDLNSLFSLGGFLNLSGLRVNSLTGPDFGIARMLAYRQIGRGGPGYLDVPTYLGISLEAGNVWQRRSDTQSGNGPPVCCTPEKDASVFLGLDTLLGPVYFATGFDEHGNQAWYLFLGRTF